MKVQIEIDDNLIHSQILSAIDAGIYYWASEFKSKKNKKGLIVGGTVTEGDTGKELKLDIKKALQLAVERCPRILDINRMDAETGDLFVQYAVFGEAKYG